MLSASDANEESAAGYAVYMLNINRYHLSNEKNIPSSKSLDSDQSNISLSLLGTNLEAEQETLVRCHIQKTLSVSDNVGFQNEGRCLQVKINEESEESFGCYYHHLVRDFGSDSSDLVEQSSCPSKKTSYFICLTVHDIEILNSFCSELGIFCNQLFPYLEPQELLLQKLKPWYFCCVEYISRCIEKFNDQLVLLFQAALHQEVTIECEDENTKWDLERFIDACSLMELFRSDSEVHSGAEVPGSPASKSAPVTFTVHLTIDNSRVLCVQELSHSSYCQKWADGLLSCSPKDHLKTRNILEMFRLKTVRDVNTMMRLLKKAENDYYSSFKAYQFYNVSGYGDVLLWHVKREALLASHGELLDTIESLSTFISKNCTDE